MTVATAFSIGLRSQARQRTILVVDHRETIRRVLSLILESEGYQVVSTDAALAALALAFEIRPSAVMLDLSLADSSASDTLRALKEDQRTTSIPVILLSDCHSPLTPAERAQAAAVLKKPLDLDALIARVEGIICESE